jgi:hypothetical protein
MPEITVTNTIRRQFRDVSLTFARNPVTHDVVTVSDADAIKRSLKLLLLSRAGETPFFPNFGSRLHRLLFEPIDPITTVLIQHEIGDTITAFEPRVNIEELSVVPTADELRYEVNLLFSIINQTQPITLTLYLTRLR